MKSFAYIASLLLVSSVAAIAESPVDGQWSGEVTNGGVTQTIQMSLRTDDTKLSGSMIGGGSETGIEDGTFIGTQLQFKTTQRDGENKLTVNCTGLLVLDSITITCKTDPETFTQEFTVTRKTQ